MSEKVNDEGQKRGFRVSFQRSEERQWRNEGDEVEKEPWKENEGGEESILFIFIPFNDSPTSFTHSIDDGEDGREDGNYENRVQSIRLSDYIELQRRLGEGLDPHLHQTEKVGEAF